MQIANSAWWRDVKIHQCRDVPWRKNAEEWWNKSSACSVLAVEVGHGTEPLWTELMVGRQIVTCLFGFKRKRLRNVDWVLHENSEGGEINLEEDEAKLSLRNYRAKACGEQWVGYVTEDHRRYCSLWITSTRGGAQSSGNIRTFDHDGGS